VSASADRRDLLTSIAYGDDPKLTAGDRLRALEGLREFEPAAVSPVDGMSEDQIWAEVDSWHEMMLSAMFVASGADLALDPKRFPRTVQALRRTVGQMTEALSGIDPSRGWGRRDSGPR
jgi:hypothetical protein